MSRLESRTPSRIITVLLLPRLKPLIMSEQQLQIDIVRLLEEEAYYNRYKFTMIPNDTYVRDYSQINRLRWMGLRKGLPDMLIVDKIKGELTFMELKVGKNKTSPAQDAWIALLGLCGIKTHIVHSMEEFKAAYPI